MLLLSTRYANEMSIFFPKNVPPSFAMFLDRKKLITSSPWLGEGIMVGIVG